MVQAFSSFLFLFVLIFYFRDILETLDDAIWILKHTVIGHYYAIKNVMQKVSTGENPSSNYQGYGKI